MGAIIAIFSNNVNIELMIFMDFFNKGRKTDKHVILALINRQLIFARRRKYILMLIRLQSVTDPYLRLNLLHISVSLILLCFTTSRGQAAGRRQRCDQETELLGDDNL